MKRDSLAKFGLERVMGYHRPIDSFNKGKKSEYYSRVCFTEEKAREKLNEDNIHENSALSCAAE